MAAVVHVKRRLDEEPLEALILTYKRRKISPEEGSGDPTLSLLKFAGTVAEKDKILSHLEEHRKSTKAQLEEDYKKAPVRITEKLRAEHALSLKENRFKIVNLFRRKAEEQEDEEITVLEIERDLEQKPEHSYVYDLYYTSSDDFGDEAQLEDYVCYPAGELAFGSYRDNGLNLRDSEDSNCENNWKNDYPDESDVESITEDDMLEAAKNLKIEDNLSDEDEDIYGQDADELDQSDVSRYGLMYAKFKARNNSNFFHYADIGDEEFD